MASIWVARGSWTSHWIWLQPFWAHQTASGVVYQVSLNCLNGSTRLKFDQVSIKTHLKVLWWLFKALEPLELVASPDRVAFRAHCSTSGTAYQVSFNSISARIMWRGIYQDTFLRSIANKWVTRSPRTSHWPGSHRGYFVRIKRPLAQSFSHN